MLTAREALWSEKHLQLVADRDPVAMLSWDVLTYDQQVMVAEKAG